MKPKDLKKAFTFCERRPLLQDHILYVPLYYAQHAEFVLPRFSEHFQNDNPVCIEYCSGNGDWIVEKAIHEPAVNWIAVERRFDRVRKIWSKLKNHALKNLLIVAGEAETFSQHYLPQSCVDGIFINFPDPWPKTKHAKNRLLQHPFLDEVARILKRDKKMTVVTDDFTYLTQTLNLLCSRVDFHPFFGAPYYQTDLAHYGSSWFEELWREKGKQINYTQFVRA